MSPRFFNPHSKKARRRFRRRIILIVTSLLFLFVGTFYLLQIKHVVQEQQQPDPIKSLILRLRELENAACRPAGQTLQVSDPFFRVEVQGLTPFDIVRGIVEGSTYTGAIVDVGANKGWPVTHVALKTGGRSVYSIEPDERNFDVLKSKYFAPNARHDKYKYIPILGAAGKEEGMAKMMFHKDRDDFTCMNCLDLKKEKVYEKEVKIHAMQNVVDEKEITLFKTDTQGFELNVLQGSKVLLDQKKIRYLLVEFDPKLLRTRENAIELLTFIENQGFKCAHLKTMTFEKGFTPTPFGRKVEKATFNAFIDHLEASKLYTDLFCFHPPNCGAAGQ